jgi:type VI protein secretion system component VasK
VEEGGCIAWLLIVVTGLALVVYEGKRLVVYLAPVWPLVVLGGVVVLVVGAVVGVFWAARGAIGEAFARRMERKRTHQQIEQAKAEIRAIHDQTAQQMARTRRRQSGS